jgi:nucleoside-diphosphate-sugar epimerase
MSSQDGQDATAIRSDQEPERSRIDAVVKPDDPILITGTSGFIGPRVLAHLMLHGFRNLRCLVRPSSDIEKLKAEISGAGAAIKVEIIAGNLLSRDDCLRATRNVALVYHLAAGRGEKAFADAVMNSVVTTRNLLDACVQHGCLKRFVSISSLSVYSNQDKPARDLLDETCAIEPEPARRGDAYSYAKLKQDQIVTEYGRTHGLPYVIVRPGVVYGPGNERIHGRVGIGTFGLFLHLGGSNMLPLTYVDNCAEAIVLAGIRPGIEKEVFNVIDDDLPSSRTFLQLYKTQVRQFKSIYVPHALSYLLCWMWEAYSRWSEGQLPPAFTRTSWRVYWKKTRYTNAKIKARLGWAQKVSSADALAEHFESCRRKLSHA